MEDIISWAIEENDILLLHGIFLKDIDNYSFKDDISNFEKSGLRLSADLTFPDSDEFQDNDLDYEAINIQKDDDIKMFFTDKESWVRETNLLCWYCCNNFSGQPWFIPIQLDKKMISTTMDEISSIADTTELDIVSNDSFQEIEVMRVFGNFCGPCCAKSYLDRSKDPELNNKWQCYELLKRLYFKMCGVKVLEIPSAENPYKMKKFCGSGGIYESKYNHINAKKIPLVAFK